MWIRRSLLLLALVVSAGCVHKVRITSEPAGAFVFLDRQRVGTTPVTVKLRAFSDPVLNVRLPGYRNVTMTLAPRALAWSQRFSAPRATTTDFIWDFLLFRWPRLVGRGQWGHVDVLLVPEHATIGAGGGVGQ